MLEVVKDNSEPSSLADSFKFLSSCVRLYIPETASLIAHMATMLPAVASAFIPTAAAEIVLGALDSPDIISSVVCPAFIEFTTYCFAATEHPNRLFLKASLGLIPIFIAFE